MTRNIGVGSVILEDVVAIKSETPVSRLAWTRAIHIELHYLYTHSIAFTGGICNPALLIFQQSLVSCSFRSVTFMRGCS